MRLQPGFSAAEPGAEADKPRTKSLRGVKRLQRGLQLSSGRSAKEARTAVRSVNQEE